MADLRTALGPLCLANPLIVASSELTMTEAGIRACVEAGAGAVVAKSVNEDPAAAEQLDIADYSVLDGDLRSVPWAGAQLGDSLFNRSGLAQSSLDDWCRMLEGAQKHAEKNHSLVVGSITVSTVEGAVRYATALSNVVPAVEINVGAPHGREASAVRQLTEAAAVGEYTRAVRSVVSGALIMKLPGQAGDIVAMADAASEAGADAVAMIGRLNGFVPDVETWEPHLGSWGAVGGQWMLPVSLYWVSKAHRHGISPVVGTNGVRSGLDVVRMMLAGASAVELVSVLLLKGPNYLRTVLAELQSYLEEHDVAAAGLVGESAVRARTYGEIPPAKPRPEPWI